ncbi:MAG: photosystem II protein PsbQ [Cyanobacteria bacterium J06638_28]
MARFRSLLSFVLAAIAVLIVGCGGANVAQPTTYTVDKIAEVQVYAPSVLELREQFPELEDYVRNKNWVDIRTFIHGPMGELRIKLARLAARLLPSDKAQAKALAEDLASHLERLDVAAEEFNQIEAAKEYRLALDDFDAFVSLIPEA